MAVMIEFREVNNESEYNPLLVARNASFTQAWFFGEWQKAMGREVIRFEIKNDSEISGFFQVIKYSLFTRRSFSVGGPFSESFLYIPHGPVLKETSYLNDEFLKTFRDKLSKIAKKENAVFVRFDTFPKTENNFKNYFKKTPTSHYHSSCFQPKYEWILNIEKSEEELLNNMHPKTRYNIGLAERKGIKVEIILQNFNGSTLLTMNKYFNDFYKLLEETAKRDNFNLHPKNYYQNIFNMLNQNDAFLAVAKYDNKILAINLILLFGNMAFFMLGGSSDEHKNLMFSHLAQWEAAKEAKRRGFKIYNFGGVDSDGEYETFGGISIFKKRFGGKLLEYSDSYDLVLKPFWYFLYSVRKWLLNLK